MSVSSIAKRRGTILDEIMAYHRQQLPKTKREVSLEDLRAFARVSLPPLNFFDSLNAPGVTLIAECKKASPSKGLMVPNYDPVKLAETYAHAGAGAISVLTDARHFQGSISDLRNVKEATAKLTNKSTQSVGIPVLRKDFIFDPYQVYESRVAGADGLLLIASVLSDHEIVDLLGLTRELGMEALVEVHTEEELLRVLRLNPRIVGVNNRNLQTFEVDFANTARLRKIIPDEIVVVGESGIKDSKDVVQMREIGVDAILVGETLVKSKDVLKTARSFVTVGRP
ncbi:MAG: indole-3-glycerol phosphate synthase TrpC [Candidatus Promineifilaceae bacterium]|nr:indole-3-glycerol phosphate synthase TrpC [Candidatus Promineifilaceae bacterium]